MSIIRYFYKFLGFKNVKGYLARPDDNQRHPGIILIHEWWGVNDNIREFAKKFAEMGYVALTVDLYVEKAAAVPAETRKLTTDVRQNMEEAFKNLRGQEARIQIGED